MDDDEQQISSLLLKRARECREIADEVQEPDWRETLLKVASDLENEAQRMESRTALKPMAAAR